MAGYEPLYLRGIEQFNRRAYFESHEVWEELWTTQQGEARHFYQGLIQAAVALHHLTNGNLPGARKLLARCRSHLAPYRPMYLGLDVDAFLAQMSECLEGFLGPEENPRRTGLQPLRLPLIRLEPPEP